MSPASERHVHIDKRREAVTITLFHPRDEGYRTELGVLIFFILYNILIVFIMTTVTWRNFPESGIDGNSFFLILIDLVILIHVILGCRNALWAVVSREVYEITKEGIRITNSIFDIETEKIFKKESMKNIEVIKPLVLFIQGKKRYRIASDGTRHSRTSYYQVVGRIKVSRKGYFPQYLGLGITHDQAVEIVEIIRQVLEID
jgi:hypothetical protein